MGVDAYYDGNIETVVKVTEKSIPKGTNKGVGLGRYTCIVKSKLSFHDYKCKLKLIMQVWPLATPPPFKKTIMVSKVHQGILCKEVVLGRHLVISGERPLSLSFH